jgi:hypothetical protein
VCWGGNSDPALYLVAGTVVAGTCKPTDGTVPQPLLSGKVTAFLLTFTSNLYSYQEANGITYWWDLDAAGQPVGDASHTLTSAELAHINAWSTGRSITQSSSGESTIPSVVAITTANTRYDDASSSIGLQLGKLSCLAVDNR